MASGSADRPRRFYKSVTVGPAPRGGWTVLLDGRAIRTPAGNALAAPTQALAQILAEEWTVQGDHVVLPDMPATRLAHTVMDHIAGARAATAAEIARYAGDDMLCYFAEGPEKLVARQTREWGPVLDWAERDLGLSLARTAGIIHQAQPEETLKAVEALAQALDDFALAALAQATGLFGSAVLALAAARGRLTALEAFNLSRLDEAFQQELWGTDEEAAIRTARMRTEVVMLGRWFEALSRA